MPIQITIRLKNVSIINILYTQQYNQHFQQSFLWFKFLQKNISMGWRDFTSRCPLVDKLCKNNSVSKFLKQTCPYYHLTLKLTVICNKLTYKLDNTWSHKGVFKPLPLAPWQKKTQNSFKLEFSSSSGNVLDAQTNNNAARFEDRCFFSHSSVRSQSWWWSDHILTPKIYLGIRALRATAVLTHEQRGVDN